MKASRTASAVATLAASLLVLTACLTQNQDPSPTAGGESAGVYSQQVHWTPCGELECTVIQVPLDWSNPDDQTIGLSVNRHPARDQEARIGSLLINPGGPGGSGLQLNEYFVESAGDRLLDHYDVVGFDPRGVGESAPINCGSAQELNEFYLTDVVLETEDDLDEAREVVAAFAARCRELSGPIIENMDTVSAARDMDVIRAVLGDDELYYLGFSYGTQLGATYAQVYPENVGRMVLDGAVDFLLPSEELSEGQARGFELALTNFIEWCLAQPTCSLSGNVDSARRQIRDVALAARDVGYSSGSTETVNGNLMVYGIVVTLYNEETWPYLDLALSEVLEQGTAGIFLELANFYLDRDSSTGEYVGNSTIAFTAVGCLDEPPADDWSIAEYRQFARDAEEASPTFGWWFGSGVGCEEWPWRADEIVTDLSAAATATTMLVVGTTNDPATPIEWSESLAERLGAELLVWDGDGHTAYGRSNQCVIDEVDAYLVDGTLPVSGTRC